MTGGIFRRIRPYLPIPEKPTVGFAFGVCAFLSAVLLIAWYLIPQSVLVWSKSSLIGFSIINVCRLLICLLLPFVFLVSRYSIGDRNVYGTNPGFGAAIQSILIGVPAMLLFVALHNLFSRFLIIRSVPAPLPMIFHTTTDTSAEATLLLFLVGSALPAILEELFFRGLLTGILPGKLWNGKGYVIIALLFAIYTLNPVDFLAVFLLGVLLGYIRHSLDNVFCAILTRLSMAGSYLLFRSLLPLIDTAAVRTEADLDSASLYIALTALIMGTLIMVPILSQIRRISGYLRLENIDKPQREEGRIRDHVGWAFWMGLLFFSGIWAMILGI